ncbi:MAG TPA: SUMF1/EgtB/PvdO family nonheme iron enzyme [Segetibacter sp.]|jgi:formylglycine-generating enzyme required for sulfatase activity
MQKTFLILIFLIIFSPLSAQVFTSEQLQTFSKHISEIQASANGKFALDSRESKIYMLSFPPENFNIFFSTSLATHAVYKELGTEKLIINESIDFSKCTGITTFENSKGNAGVVVLTFPTGTVKTKIIQNAALLNSMSSNKVEFYYNKENEDDKERLVNLLTELTQMFKTAKGLDVEGSVVPVNNVIEKPVVAEINVAALKVAFQENNRGLISAFIDSNNVNDKIIDGEVPLISALRLKSDALIIKYLIEQGAAVDYFASRFQENNSIYKTPLALACLNGDFNVLTTLIEERAPMYPAISTNKEKRQHARFYKKNFSEDVLTLLDKSGYDLDDGSSAIKSIEGSMVLIEGGSFTMGCVREQGDLCPADELPLVPDVKVNSFYLSKFELTQEEWEKIMDENPSNFTGCNNCPVEMVNWNDIQVFLTKLNQLSGKKFRLPTEVEWEFAAKERGNSSALFSGGNNLESISWSLYDSEQKTHPVGQKKPNALGLYDMSGNVYEWCSNAYTENLTKFQSSADDGTDTKLHVLRGGSWNHSKRNNRVSFREHYEPELRQPTFGFRLAMDK